jgi:hypothetical protein
VVNIRRRGSADEHSLAKEISVIAETIIVDEWTYLVGIGILLLVWASLYVARRDLHRRMLTVSLLLIPLAPLGQYLFLQDYWRPPIIFPIVLSGRTYGGVADLAFTFVMGGLATAAYPVLASKYPVRDVRVRRHWVALAFILIEGLSIVVLTMGLHVNSIFSSSIGFVVIAVAIVVMRRDLWPSVVISGLLCGIALAGAEGMLSFIVPLYLSRYWLLYNTSSGILIFNRVPLTEAIWGAAFGMAIGPLYDAYEGHKLLTRHHMSVRKVVARRIQAARGRVAIGAQVHGGRSRDGD